MSYIITKSELEHMSIIELRSLYHNILSGLSKRGLSAQDCPLIMITLENIRHVLGRKQALKPLVPCF